VCPACNARRMVQTAAHRADHVMPRLPVRQWVLSVPKRASGWRFLPFPRALLTLNTKSSVLAQSRNVPFVQSTNVAFLIGRGPQRWKG
jgi:hypothetical protein